MIDLLSTVVNSYNIYLGLNVLRLILVISVGCLVSWYIQFCWNTRHISKLAAKIPHFNVSRLPIIGIAHHLIGDTENMLNTVMKFCSNGTPVMDWLGFDSICFLHRPEDIEIVLNSQKTLAKFSLYRYITLFTGDGIFSAPVPIWKKHRKAILPSFNQKILNTFFNIFLAQSKVFISVMENNEGIFIDIDEKLTSWGLDTISESAMGVELNAQTTDSKFVSSLHRLLEIAITRIVNIIYHNEFIYSLTNMAKDEKECVRCVHKFVDVVLAEKYKTIEERRKLLSEHPEAEIDEPKQIPFLDMFIAMNFTDLEIRDETITLLFAGSDTSATTIGFTLIMLAMHPHVQHNIYEEVVDVMANERDAVLEDLSKFKYMERVIKETMRLFPVGPFTFRDVDEDLQINNYILPKGSGVGIAAISMHRSPEYYPNPLKFDPDRFLPEEVAKRHPYAYIPFSAGPRNCIGVKYAMMSMKTLIATIVRKYKIETSYKRVEDVKCKQDVVIKPINGFIVKFTKRHNV